MWDAYVYGEFGSPGERHSLRTWVRRAHYARRKEGQRSRLDGRGACASHSPLGYDREQKIHSLQRSYR